MENMKIKMLIIFCIFIISCTSFNHQHDGKYVYNSNIFGFNFMNVSITIDGENLKVENSTTGISEFKCKQYDDRVEYGNEDGMKMVLSFLQNGDLKLSEQIVLKKINESSDIKKSIESTKIDSTIHGQYAFITHIDNKSITFDFVDIKMNDKTINDFEIINESKELKTFELANCNIENCYNDLVLTQINFQKIKKELISKKILVEFNAKNDKLTALEIGCINRTNK